MVRTKIPAPDWPEWTKKSGEHIPKIKNRRRVVDNEAYDPTKINWLWYPYIPRGMVTMLEGDPGLGKSWISYAIAADLSKGRSLPGMEHKPHAQNTLLINAEDPYREVQLPRLISQDANRSRTFVPPEIALEEDLPLLNPDGIALLEHYIGDSKASICFLDPLVAFLGGKMDMNKANEVRQVMRALSVTAQRTGCAIVTVRHLRKASQDGGKAIYAGLGSIDFSAAVRSAIAVYETKGGQRVVRHIKSNIGPKGPPLTYTIEHGTDGSRFAWGGLWDGEEEDILKPGAKVGAKVIEARAWLADKLRSSALRASEVLEMAIEDGIAEKTLKRAKINTARSENRDGEWWWVLEGGDAYNDNDRPE